MDRLLQRKTIRQQCLFMELNANLIVVAVAALIFEIHRHFPAHDNMDYTQESHNYS